MNKTAAAPAAGPSASAPYRDLYIQKRFILSGLLRSPAREVRRRLGRLPVRILREWSCDGIWHTYYGTITARAAPSMPSMDPKG